MTARKLLKETLTVVCKCVLPVWTVVISLKFNWRHTNMGIPVAWDPELLELKSVSCVAIAIGHPGVTPVPGTRGLT